MDKPKISIIVPIYNMELYLRECLESIRNQTFTDWEYILVDDGSSDNSPAICDEYAALDSRLKAIHKANGGLSDARNAGLKAASGSFIGFVDSDDWIEPGMFKLLYDLITDNNADIAEVGFIREYKGRHSTKHLTHSLKIMTGNDAMREMGFDRLPNYVWNKLHRREIITCDFPKGRNFEDIFVYGQWLKNVKRMVLDATPMYHYRMRKGSIIHSDVAKNRYDFYNSCIDRMNMVKHYMNVSVNSQRANAYVNKSAVGAAKIIARTESNETLRDMAIKKISDDVKSYPLPSILHMGLKAWWRAKFLRDCPGFFRRLMKGVSFFDFDRKDKERRYYD